MLVRLPIPSLHILLDAHVLGSPGLQSNQKRMHGYCRVKVGILSVALENRAMYCCSDSLSPFVSYWRDADEATMGLLPVNLTVNHAHNVSKESTEFGS